MAPFPSVCILLSSSFRNLALPKFPAGVNIDLINLWKQCNKVERHCTEEAFKYHRNKLSEAGIGRLENRTTQLDANLSKQVQVWHIVEEFCITVCDQFLWEEQMSAQVSSVGSLYHCRIIHFPFA